MKLLKLLLILTFSLSTFSEFSSLSWQKIKLENELQQKLSDVIKRVDSNVKHVVDVKINLKEIEEPEFSKSTPPSGGNNGAKRAPASSVPMKKSVVNFSDDPGEEKRVESVILSKFGIMAPLVDDFNVEKSEPKRSPASESGSGAAKSAPPINNIEEKFKVLSSLDIFKYIDKVSANLVVDNNISSELKKSIEETLKVIEWSVGGVKFSPNISYKQLSKPIEVKEKTIVDYIKDYETIIAFSIGALAFLLTMIIFAKKLESAFKSLNSSGTGASSANSTPVQQEKEASEQSKEKIVEDNYDHLNLDGIERFLHFFHSFPEEGKFMIQGWLKTDNDDTALKMNAVAQKLSNKDLANVLSLLTDDERNDWRSHLGASLDRDQMIRASFLISQDVLSAMVSPSSNMEPHVFDVMVSLSAENAAKFVEDHVELSPILYTELNSKIMSDIIKFTNKETVEKMIALSLTFEPSDNKDKYKLFEKEVIKYHHEKVKLPGMKKVGEILNNVTQENELSIFRTIANIAGATIVRDSANSQFPTFLFKKLPVEFLKNIIISYQITKRVNLIYSLGDEGQFYLDLYAPVGSRAREMFDLEVEKIEMDKSLQKQIISNKEEIWQDFVSFVRKKIENNSEYEEEVNAILDEWITQNSNNEAPKAA